MRSAWNFFSAGQLVFGWRAVEQLPCLVARHQWRRLLILSDRNLQSSGIVERLTDVLRGDLQVEVFAGGAAEPAISVAHEALAAARQFQPDVLLGLGGGSNMDLAKFTAVLHHHGGVPQDYFGFDRVPGPVTPLICVPTTAGTGSEVSHAAVLTDTDNEMKVSCLSNYLRPTLAIVDPDLTLSCPPQVTADSGIDALTHAVEAYTAVDFDQLEVPPGESCPYEGRYPLGNCLAEQAIQLVGRHLVTAVREPQDRAAREGMALAATIAGLAFSNCGVALVHALEYPLGGILHCSHGAGNGLLLPYVMRFNLPERAATIARIGELLGVEPAASDQRAAAEAAIAAIEELRRQINIPLTIRALGGTREQLPLFAQKAFAIKRLQWINPRPCSLDDLQGIYEAAFE